MCNCPIIELSIKIKISFITNNNKNCEQRMWFARQMSRFKWAFNKKEDSPKALTCGPKPLSGTVKGKQIPRAGIFFTLWANLNKF